MNNKGAIKSWFGKKLHGFNLGRIKMSNWVAQRLRKTKDRFHKVSNGSKKFYSNKWSAIKIASKKLKDKALGTNKIYAMGAMSNISSLDLFRDVYNNTESQTKK